MKLSKGSCPFGSSSCKTSPKAAPVSLVQPYITYTEINFIGDQMYAPKGIFWDIPRRCVALGLSGHAESLKRQHCGIT